VAGPSCPQLLTGSPELSIKTGPLAKAAANPVYGPVPLYASARETHIKFWTDVALPPELLAHYVNNKACYADQMTFSQCMAAINALLGGEEVRAELIPGSAFLEGEFKLEVARDMGEARIAVWKPTKTEPREILKERHAFDKACREGWMRLIKTGKQVDLDRMAYGLVMGLRQDPEASFKVASAINEYLQVEDAHARIMPLEMLKQETSSDVTDKLVGIGIQVSENAGNIHIEGIIDGGPAHAGGLLAGDIILAVDGHTVAADLKAAIQKLRGPEDTRVVLKVKRGAEEKEFTLIRKPVEMKNVTAKLVNNGKAKLGHVTLQTFMVDNAAEQISASIKQMEAEGAQALVLDLRGNGGGALKVAVDIAGLFLGPNKKVVVSKSLYPRFIKDETYITSNDAVTTLPLVVLVDPGSASASELLSGALQDHKRAWIVGERTFGKGTVQTSLRPVGDNQILQHFPVVLFQTIARFYLPSGRTNQLVGVSPDFEATFRPGEVTKHPREEDIYPNALTSEGEASHSSRPEETVLRLKACLESTGVAKANYKTGNNGLPRDYPMHVVFDLMSCFDQLNVHPVANEFR